MKAKKGFSLVEVLVSLLIISLIAVASLRTYIMANELSYIEGIRASAIYLAQETLERALADDFDDVVIGDQYPENMQGILVDSRGTTDPSDDIIGSQTIQINDWSDTERQQKEVIVTIGYTFNGTPYSEELVTWVVAAGR